MIQYIADKPLHRSPLALREGQARFMDSEQLCVNQTKYIKQS